ncbi:hypothetical protein LCGC14_0710330 [marine sediment metagenome]|uniref:DUF4129 domain-containing protein n=1 Tax=marine sediment metagenome TaxID=412755 RepID=A0A0F9QF81_9ZZZZ|nr:hypothetical protein [bacterium]
MAKKKKKKSLVQEIDIKQKLENVKVLVNTNRPKEAVAYIYLIYDDLIRTKFNKPRLIHQTIREYAITCVKELEKNLKPESVYPFIKKIEDIIYGGIEPTKKELNFTIDLFSNLYNDITGKEAIKLTL